MLRAKLTQAVQVSGSGIPVRVRMFSAGTDFERKVRLFAQEDRDLKAEAHEAIKQGNDNLAWLRLLNYLSLLDETLEFINKHRGLITNANKKQIEKIQEASQRNLVLYDSISPTFDVKMALILLQVFSYEELLEGASNEERAKQISFVLDELIKYSMPSARIHLDIKRLRKIVLGLVQLGYLNSQPEHIYSCPYQKIRALVDKVNERPLRTLSPAYTRITYTHPSEHYKDLLGKLGRNPDIDAFQYNGKTLKDWGSELREKLRESTPEVITEMALSSTDIKKIVSIVDDIQNPKPEPVIQATVTTAVARSNGYPNNGTVTRAVVKTASPTVVTKPIKLKPVQLPKLSKEDITSQLKNAEEILKLILPDLVNETRDEEMYWSTCSEWLSSDYASQAKPLLNLILSYIEGKNSEGFANLDELTDGFNMKIKAEYSPVTRDELIDFTNIINKFLNESYDPGLQNGVMTTDITNGDRNETDELVLKAFEEQLKYPSVPYTDFLKQLSQSQTIKGKLGELEITQRIEYKLSLTDNDYHIIRAFRELGGNRDIEVIPDRLQKQLDQKHPEYKKDEISDLSARLDTLKEFFPNLLGIKNQKQKTQSNPVKNEFDELLSRPVASWSSNIDALLYEVYGKRSITRVASDDIRRGYNGLQPRKVAALGLDREIKIYNHQGTIVTIKYADDIKDKPKEITTRPLTKDEFGDLVHKINEQKTQSRGNS